MPSLAPFPDPARDLKPSNVLLSFNKELAPGAQAGLGDSAAARCAPGLLLQAKVCDLGSSAWEGHLVPPSGRVGTASYMAPEMDDDAGPYDAAVDVFSWGRMLWDMK